jgi:methylated-DNA-[protein]-cysteine S-methyltransferase
MDRKARLYYESPIGLLEISGGDSGIESVSFAGRRRGPAEKTRVRPEVARLLEECAAQLDEYFAGRRKAFRLRLAPSGTDFQERVWRALLEIPFGRTKSYKDVARAVGNVRATRAVGGANHRNPIAVIIPCHRVIGNDGRLTGYGAGLWRKAWLLAHEDRAGRCSRRGGKDRPRRPVARDRER